MRHILLRVIVFLFLTLGVAAVSILIYIQFFEHDNQLEMRGEIRSELLENVGRLLVEWHRDGASASSKAYLAKQLDHGFGYTLFDAHGRVLLGRQPDQELVSLTQHALQKQGYAYKEMQSGFPPPPPMSPPGRESLAFIDREGVQYAIGLAATPPPFPHEGRPRPLLFIGAGACVAILLLFALLRISGRTVMDMRAALGRLAKGDFDTRLDSALEQRKDAFSKLAKDFNLAVTQLADKHAEQRYLISELTHEMRSPLTRMTLAMELAKTAAPDKSGQLMQRLKADSDALNSIFEKLMDYVRQQWDETEKTSMDLSALACSVARSCDEEARLNGKQVLYFDCGDCRICGNSRQLASMIRNVLRNAVRHTKPGTSVELHIAAGAEDATITITDHGPGLPPDMLEKVFEPFRQSGYAKGEAGLGLAIARLVATRHGGTITLQNRVDGGAMATIRLPLLQDKTDKDEKSAAVLEDVQSAVAKTLHVLRASISND